MLTCATVRTARGFGLSFAWTRVRAALRERLLHQGPSSTCLAAVQPGYYFVAVPMVSVSYDYLIPT
jgi:hypothetical protein